VDCRVARAMHSLLAMTLAVSRKAQPVQGLKGGKFEMNRSQCPVAKILVYKIVHEFSSFMAQNFASEPREPTED
jgi:hypothetical protein